MSQPHWYVIRTKPREEMRSVAELTRQGIEAFCPLTREYRWKKRRHENIPLFPGYVFSRFSFPEDFYRVKWARGVSRIVQFGDTPTPLDEPVMDFFLEAMDENGVIDQSPSLKEGDPVQFKYGPLKGLVGRILRADTADERVLVLMDHLSYQARLLVDGFHVQAI